MIRITRQTDYGIVLLSTLARAPRTWSAAELAEATHVTSPMVSKILKLLARAGILTSQRGAKGGYRLARGPEKITVVEMITALEGPIAITECVDPAGNCEQQCWCHVHPSWQRINDALRSTLERITLAQMAQPLVCLPQKAAAALGRACSDG